MKKVFNSVSDVFHVFAQQSQTEARSSNVFMSKEYGFKGDYANKIYSYGYHYLLGQFLNDPKGKQVLYINNSGYSVSTAKHINELRSATRQHLQIFETDTIKPVIREVKEAFNSLSKAKKPEIYISAILKRKENFFSDFFQFVENDREGLQFLKFSKLPVEVQKEIKECRKICTSLDSNFDLKAYQRAEREKADKAKKAKEKKFFEALKKWSNNDISRAYLPLNPTGEDFLRISQDQTEIQTTQGVEVDIKEAAMLYSLIKAGKDIKGQKIGHYTVISLNGVLTIGCHRINAKNMHEIGEKALNIVNGERIAF